MPSGLAAAWLVRKTSRKRRFLQALKHLTQLRCDQSAAKLVASNCSTEFFAQGHQAQSRREQSAMRPTPRSNWPWRCAEVPDVAQQLENRDAVQAALDQLGTGRRLVVVMYYFEVLSYNEIAKSTPDPIGTVMSRLNRSREALRRVWRLPK